MKSDFENQAKLFFFSSIKGLGIHTIWSLIKLLDGSANLYQAALDKHPDLDNKVGALIRAKQRDRQFISQVKQEFSQIKEDYLSILDQNYPELLKNIYDPPLFLFYRGNINILKDKLITVIGSRTVTDYHINSTKQIVKNLKPLTIVSGLAKGIDSISHQAALNNNLKTIAVLGSSLRKNLLYPQCNLELAQRILDNNGLLLSEYPANTKTEQHHFPRRNRILAGLSAVTIVISGAQKSGTLITAQVALDEGREIYALPGNIDKLLSYGPNSLINNGANILISKKIC